MLILLPDPALTLLMGASGSGKSTFARRHFRATEILSSDFCRALVSDDESDQSATDEAFELLFFILEKRLKRRRNTVIDATNVQQFSRTLLIDMAKRWDIPPVAILFVLPEETCQSRNRERAYRQVPPDVISRQLRELSDSVQNLTAEGFQSIFTFHTAGDADTASVIRQTSHS